MSALTIKRKAPASKKFRKENKKEREKVGTILKNVRYSGDIEKYLFTHEQVDSFMELKTREGNFFLNTRGRKLKLEIYEFVGGCDKFVREGGSIQKLLSVIDNLLTSDFIEIESIKDVWFIEEKKAYEEENNRLKRKISIKKGVFTCPECVGRKNKITNDTETVQFQTRSSDEPMTNFNECLQCNHRWVV